MNLLQRLVQRGRQAVSNLFNRNRGQAQSAGGSGVA